MRFRQRDNVHRPSYNAQFERVYSVSGRAAGVGDVRDSHSMTKLDELRRKTVATKVYATDSVAAYASCDVEDVKLAEKFAAAYDAVVAYQTAVAAYTKEKESLIVL